MGSRLEEARRDLYSYYRDLSTRLLSDLRGYYGDYMKIVDVQRFVERLSGKNLGEVGMGAIIETIREINGGLVENVKANFVYHAEDLRYFIAIEPDEQETLSKILNIPTGILKNTLVEERRIVFSPDNKDLELVLADTLRIDSLRLSEIKDA